MKIEFIKRGAETRLILIFAGWSTDTRFYSGCVAEGWDTAVVSDYLDLSMPEIPEQYSTIYLFAYSLGVWAASCCGVDAALHVAICGTCAPVSDYLGIPENIFIGTAENLNARNLLKFHRRMAGDRNTFDRLAYRLDDVPDISALKEELLNISDRRHDEWNSDYRWDRAYVAMLDNIFPPDNQLRFWSEFTDTQIVKLQAPHCVDIADIVRHCVPDDSKVQRGFSRALTTYRKNAMVQTEVCDRIENKLKILFGFGNDSVGSLLEIGAGCGLLSDRWSRVIHVESATYVDLVETPKFGKAENEEYIVADAEEWLEASDRKFDVILSASTIQWFVDPVRFVKIVKSHLNKDGVALLSTFVTGNLVELDALRPSPIIYRKGSDYKVSSDILTEQWTRTLYFDSPRDMLMHLRNTGVTPHSDRHDKTIRSGAFGSHLKMSEIPTQLTYTPMILVIHAE